MFDKCPYVENLACTKIDRQDEFYRQMDDAMMSNKHIVFITSGLCPAQACMCIKLQEFKEKMQKQR